LANISPASSAAGGCGKAAMIRRAIGRTVHWFLRDADASTNYWHAQVAARQTETEQLRRAGPLSAGTVVTPDFMNAIMLELLDTLPKWPRRYAAPPSVKIVSDRSQTWLEAWGRRAAVSPELADRLMNLMWRICPVEAAVRNLADPYWKRVADENALLREALGGRGPTLAWSLRQWLAELLRVAQ
jgi:hypothetical protein